MEYSKSGFALTKGFESCCLTAYQDVKGIWTIGWGHTGTDVREGLTITQNQADALLMQDMQVAVNHVNHLVTVQLTQGEFDALVDFVYNVGGGNFADSTMLRYLNAGNYTGAAGEFERWSLSGGKQVAGLLRRRQAEEQEFNA